MNYSESKTILEEVQKAKKILLNCHRNPDPDSVGSALAMYKVLTDMGKIVKIIFPGEDLPTSTSFLYNSEKIDLINFESFDFSKYDLFVCLDSANWYMVSGSKEISIPSLPIIVIEHHFTAEKYGKVNLIDREVTSTGELLYRIFEDWGISIDKHVATCLLTGIIGDTGVFKYAGTGWPTLDVAGKLMKAGADKDHIVLRLFGSTEFKLIKFWGEVLQKMKIEEKYKFVWSAISYQNYLTLGKLGGARDSAASLFAGVVEGTDFGIIMVEVERNILDISLRSRTGFDTTEIALALGGGGHIYSSGAEIKGLPFHEAVEKVLSTARKFADEHKT